MEPPSVTAESGPTAAIAELRNRLVAGERLSVSAQGELNRAIHALDPRATEETLSTLVGSGSTHLYGGLIGWAALVAGERVLDVGCGSGGATRIAAKLVGPEGTVVGIDPVAEALAVARAEGTEGATATFRKASAENLSAFGDRSFDCVVASLVLDEVADLAQSLKEIARVLRPGGRFVASVMAFDHLRTQDAAFMGSVLAVVARHSPGSFGGQATRASLPGEPEDAAAFKQAGLLVPEERDLNFSLVMNTIDEAWALFSRTKIAYFLDDAGQAAMREAIERHLPHMLALPIRFLRSRRPG